MKSLPRARLLSRLDPAIPLLLVEGGAGNHKHALLAEWAACSAETSAPLIDRLEALGYAVRGKSREAVTEVLKHPPTGPRRG